MLAKNLSLLKSAITAPKQDQRQVVRADTPITAFNARYLKLLTHRTFFSTLDSQHFLKTESQTPSRHRSGI